MRRLVGWGQAPRIQLPQRAEQRRRGQAPRIQGPQRVSRSELARVRQVLRARAQAQVRETQAQQRAARVQARTQVREELAAVAENEADDPNREGSQAAEDGDGQQATLNQRVDPMARTRAARRAQVASAAPEAIDAPPRARPGHPRRSRS